jgi:hypothetical protein
MPNPEPPLRPTGYEIGALEPVFIHAIRKNRPPIVDHFAVLETIDSNASSDIFQVVLNHGRNIN